MRRGASVAREPKRRGFWLRFLGWGLLLLILLLGGIGALVTLWESEPGKREGIPEPEKHMPQVRQIERDGLRREGRKDGT